MATTVKCDSPQCSARYEVSSFLGGHTFTRNQCGSRVTIRDLSNSQPRPTLAAVAKRGKRKAAAEIAVGRDAPFLMAGRIFWIVTAVILLAAATYIAAISYGLPCWCFPWRVGGSWYSRKLRSAAGPS